MSSLSKIPKRIPLPQLVVILLLLALLLLGAVPGYLQGHWKWQEPARVVTLGNLKQLRQTGLKVAGWQNLDQGEAPIGGHKWSRQIIQKQGEKTQALLLLLPQNGPRDQPQVEWTEIEGWQRWRIAQLRTLQFTAEQPQAKNSQTAKVEARFFRGSNREQTYAILQWYAWFNGGSAAPIKWFLADQLAQWHHKRVPWVAISIMIPIEPLGDIEKSWQLAESLGKTVQAALMTDSLLTSE
ncbi:MAG: cyanoexosortase B system-associated protein [Nostocaceae cyanobacterium]|nr:cyanoexosortase B system-associated protein [Nostocaceae cyanobacterium]